MVNIPGLLHATVEEGVACLTLDDPASGNALSAAMVTAITDACEAFGRDPAVRVLLLFGNQDVFSSGAPAELLAELTRGGSVAPGDIRLAKALLDLPVPAIAAVEGHAVGGGLALALAADIVVLARESRYGLPFLDLGFTPGMGTTRLLEHALSPAVAHELLFTGEMRRGADFAGRGINHILPRAEVRGKAVDLARRIADKPRRALELLKRTLSLPRRRIFEETYTLETLMHHVSFADLAARQRREQGGAPHVE